MQSFSGRMPTKKDCKYREIFTNCQTASEVWHILAYSPQKSSQTAAEWAHWKRVYVFAPRECDTQNAQDAVSPSQHSPGKYPSLFLALPRPPSQDPSEVVTLRTHRTTIPCRNFKFRVKIFIKHCRIFGDFLTWTQFRGDRTEGLASSLDRGLFSLRFSKLWKNIFTYACPSIMAFSFVIKKTIGILRTVWHWRYSTLAANCSSTPSCRTTCTCPW